MKSFMILKISQSKKELFQVKDTSICTSYPKENVICVNLDLCKDRSLVYIYLAHEKDANLFANFIAIVIFKRVLDIKEMDQKEYEFKTKLFMNFFASNPVKKKLIQKEIRRH